MTIDLDQFTGTETYHRYLLGTMLTDGTKYLAEKAGAFWLMDEIATGQMLPKVRAEEFQVWKLKVADSKGVLTCDDGNNNVVYTKKIEFTDFPLPEVEIYFENKVIHLPSER